MIPLAGILGVQLASEKGLEGDRYRKGVLLRLLRRPKRVESSKIRGVRQFLQALQWNDRKSLGTSVLAYDGRG